MELKQNVSLADYSTMRLGGKAAFLIEIKDMATFHAALALAQERHLPTIMVGGGSNIIWRDEGFQGLVLINRLKGFAVEEIDDTAVYITVGAGEVFDEAIARSVEMGLSGIECLSLIPGTAGATPIQNVGAYGQDISQTLVTLSAYDTQTAQLVTLSASDCQFAYRSSIFNTTAKGRYFILSITLMLTKTSPMPPFYPALSSYLEHQGITEYTAAALRNAVIDIRKSKLPDPKLVANCGSFFGNPLVDPGVLETIKENYSDVPHWPTADGHVKLSAAWLIDQAGFRDYFDPETGMATWDSQPLVFTNRSAKTTADLYRFVEKVKSKVYSQFGVDLVQEPLLLP